MNYFEVENIQELINSPQAFQEGQICYEQNSDKVMVYHDKQWTPLEKTKVNVDSTGVEMSLYDLNKNIMSQLPALSPEKIAELKELILTFDNNIDNTYYMLLSREENYFTLFVKNGCLGINAINESVIDCLRDLGDIVSGEITKDKMAIEFWVKTDKDAFCVYFFGYDRGVVECV